MATDQLGGNSSLFWERYEMATRRMRDDWHCRLELLHKRKLANAARQLVLFLGRKAKKKKMIGKSPQRQISYEHVR